MKKLFLFLLFTLAISAVAFAHEKRGVGDLQIVVGFVNEPAFSGEMNGIDLRVKTADDQPVEGLEKSLKAEVRYADRDEVMELTFRKRYKQPGVYAAYFLPSRPGQYHFRIMGQAGEQAIDETFSSGERFHDVENSKELFFPNVKFES